jgi:hypothetical protein
MTFEHLWAWLRSTQAARAARQPAPAAPIAPPDPLPNSSAAPEPAAEAIIQAPRKEQTMKFADFLRGVAQVALADVAKVFSDAKALVTAAPIPANVKTDLTQTLTDSEADLNGLASLAGTELGTIVADAVDDGTTLFMNLAEAVQKGSGVTAASSAAVQQGVTAVIAQLQTLVAQTVASAKTIGAQPAAVATTGAATALNAS